MCVLLYVLLELDDSVCLSFNKKLMCVYVCNVESIRDDACRSHVCCQLVDQPRLGFLSVSDLHEADSVQRCYYNQPENNNRTSPVCRPQRCFAMCHQLGLTAFKHPVLQL